MTKRDCEVIETHNLIIKFKLEIARLKQDCEVKIKFKLTNLMKLIRIEGYNSKYGLNPHGIKKMSDVLFEFDQIGQ